MGIIFCLNKKEKLKSFSEPLLEIKKELLKATTQTSVSTSQNSVELVVKIKETVADLNKNNVTRTKAYLDFYILHPEIHWALLGHMVSRNGGWNMTDLKGDFISNLLDKGAKTEFFSFLERGNWLIFQDVYPQFMLYEESLKRNESLFYLLPFFNVSIFMKTIWDYFWKYRDTYILTMGLVINEQNYLENHVMKNNHFQEKVFQTLEYKLQEGLSFNHVLFPFQENGKRKLVGQTLHRFEAVEERILLGKRLYSLLFSNQSLLTAATSWARTYPHTGSRKDYWPHLFNDVKEYSPGSFFTKRLKKCQLRPGASRIYSPRLIFAWKNVDHLPPQEGDWFHDWRVMEYLQKEDKKVNGDIVDEYCETLENLELATIAKKAIFL